MFFLGSVSCGFLFWGCQRLSALSDTRPNKGVISRAPWFGVLL